MVIGVMVMNGSMLSLGRLTYCFTFVFANSIDCWTIPAIRSTPLPVSSLVVVMNVVSFIRRYWDAFVPVSTLFITTVVCAFATRASLASNGYYSGVPVTIMAAPFMLAEGVCVHKYTFAVRKFMYTSYTAAFMFLIVNMVYNSQLTCGESPCFRQPQWAGVCIALGSCTFQLLAGWHGFRSPVEDDEEHVRLVEGDP